MPLLQVYLVQVNRPRPPINSAPSPDRPCACLNKQAPTVNNFLNENSVDRHCCLVLCTSMDGCSRWSPRALCPRTCLLPAPGRGRKRAARVGTVTFGVIKMVTFGSIGSCGPSAVHAVSSSHGNCKKKSSSRGKRHGS
jgi:hypothetical protein